MAKFNEYTQKATPEDADTLMIYDAAAKANKLSPFSGIWNWIVGKLTNAVISNLQANNKTVIGALNELNSNRFKANSYIISSDRSTKTVNIKWNNTNEHMASFLLIDSNNYVSAYVTGKGSGVVEISKGSGSTPPVLDASSATLKVTLVPWSTALLICLSPVTIS
jgi:hypothetical protein|nr:MAG TPA: hypothetical protein [Caudoviricetes sp.]